MNLIYIGSIYPPGQIDKLKSLGSSVDFAAETFQSSLTQGLSNYYPKLKIITAPNISNYPKIKKKKFSKQEFNLPFNNIKHIFTGFINIPILKHISKIIRVRKAIKSSLDKYSDNKILIYGVHSPFLLALTGINKKKYKSCLIVPDLPEFMSGNKKKSYLLGKKIDKFFINIGLNNIDSFVLFSPHMREKFNINSKPWIHIEGIFCNKENDFIIKKVLNKTILYSGMLNKRYGIMDLVYAFNQIDKYNYKLLLCGDGDAVDEIKKYQEGNSKIEYIGLLSTYEVRKLQKEVTLLVNPRHSKDLFTKYSFPSKTMEYMASGTPTLMARLASIPSEYEPYIYFFDNESVEGMKNKIIEICEKPQEELDAFGKAASEFILSEKNEIIQAKKIVDLIDSL